MIPRIGVEWLKLKTPALSMMSERVISLRPPLSHLSEDQPTFVDNDKHGISFGAGFEIQTRGAIIDGPLTIDIAALWIELADHHGKVKTQLTPLEITRIEDAIGDLQQHWSYVLDEPNCAQLVFFVCCGCGTVAHGGGAAALPSAGLGPIS